MATKLTDYYTQATAKFGVAGRMKLAMLTKVPSERAASEPDSPAHLATFESAWKQLQAA